ncbi:MAG: hypothetical protein CL946_04900 [Ectothiorhodospiraceae bacterium]|nr:hypothetical protein [Ectothiorhodospiraceae bacterium]
MKVASPTDHYRIDAEEFDYFSLPNRQHDDDARRKQEAVTKAASFPHSGRVLDIGAGNGWVQRILKASNCQVVNMELGIVNLKKLRAELGSQILCVVADAARLPFRSGAFDSIVASEMLEHVNEPAQVVQESARCLMNGGRLTVSTPYKENIPTYLCIHCNKPTPANAHIHTFDEHRHASQLKSSGFSEIRFFLIQNKVLHLLRISHFLRFLPYTLWRIIDRFSNLLVRKVQTIVVTARKVNARESSR